MKKIGIITKKGEPAAISAVQKMLPPLKGKGFQFLVESEVASSLRIKGFPRKEIARRSDIIIVFGGDGTLLSVARLVGDLGVPILGVNLGSLGFITEIGRDAVQKEIAKVLAGKFTLEERIMLTSDIFRGKKNIISHNALNDIVLHKSALARMFEVDIRINSQYVSTFRADGLIVSTPTGSTAHSLSAGGPILYPTLESFLMTPICPHTLTSRPIVLPDSFVVEIGIKSGTDVYLTLDGQVGFPLKSGDRVRIKKAEYKSRFVVLHTRDYFKLLRNKLKWGE